MSYDWYPEPKEPFPWGMTIGLTVFGILFLGWGLLISLGNVEQSKQLAARGCVEVYDATDARLAGKIVDMSREVYVCKDGGIVYR